VYLLDTNVVSELRRPRPHGGVLAWLGGVADEELYISAVTLGELQAGVELTREQDAARAAELENWIDALAQASRILPLDGPILRAWAKLMHRRSEDFLADALIAATAVVHRLIVVTRNVSDFRSLGVETFDPFQGRK
jgi:predicted nucleic acid-binding protein